MKSSLRNFYINGELVARGIKGHIVRFYPGKHLLQVVKKENNNLNISQTEEKETSVNLEIVPLTR